MLGYFGCDIVLCDVITANINCTYIDYFGIETLGLRGEDCTGMVLCYLFQQFDLFFSFGLFFLEVASHHEG